jgi:nucleoid DNA-binding protein/DNA-binding XRE family transcriptional regulator
MTQTKTIFLPQASRMMTKVQVDKSKNQLHVWFADGVLACVPVEEIEKAGPPVTLNLNQIELSDPYVLRVGTSKGDTEEIPWDFFRHYCDPAFAQSEQKRDELSQEALGQRIRELREQANFTQEQLADKANVGRITVSRIENGKLYAHTDTLRRIAKALETDLVNLLISDRKGNEKTAVRVSPKGGKTTKARIIKLLAVKTGLRKEKARQCFNSFLDLIVESVARNESVVFPGFGTFGARLSMVTRRVNPRTAQRMVGSPKTRVYFRASKAFKRALAKIVK